MLGSFVNNKFFAIARIEILETLSAFSLTATLIKPEQIFSRRKGLVQTSGTI